jgi:uncharacterized protein
VSEQLVQVQVRAILPISGGCAVFLGDGSKVFDIHVDRGIGAAIEMFLRDIKRERPQTHDLMAALLEGLGAKVERAIITEVRGAVYYARLVVSAENELHSRKLVVMDARPSDSIALAVREGAPIYVSRELWDLEEDMSEILESMEQGGFGIEEEEA